MGSPQERFSHFADEIGLDSPQTVPPMSIETGQGIFDNTVRSFTWDGATTSETVFFSFPSPSFKESVQRLDARMRQTGLKRDLMVGMRKIAQIIETQG
jgi:polyisoprenoid-binding protein YceI